MLRCCVDKEIDLCLIKGEGTINIDDVESVIYQGINAPAWHPKQNVLIDNRDITHTLPYSDFSKVVHLVRAANLETNTKHAILVGNGFFAAVAKLWQAFSSSLALNYMIFTEVSDACAWLNVDIASVEETLTNMKNHSC